MKIKHISSAVLGTVLIAGLAACGGGGGGGGSSDPAPVTRTLSGVGAKGLIANGIVNVYAVSAAGVRGTAPIATVRTNAAGVYTLSLGNNIGLFTVEISGDSTTTIADEATGQNIPMPAALVLRSLVTLDAAATSSVSANISPFSEMIISAAISAGGLNTANISAARSGVTKLLGFDPLAVKPVNLNQSAAATATQDEQLQAVALAALSKLANTQGSLGCSGTQAELLLCVISAAGKVTLTNGTLSITPEAQVAVRAAMEAVVKDPAINKSPLTSLAGLPSFTQSSVPVAAGAITSLESVKALFASLRSNYAALTATGGGVDAITLSADKFASDFDKAVAPVDKDLVNVVALMNQGASLYNDFVANSAIRSSSSAAGQCNASSDEDDNFSVNCTTPSKTVGVNRGAVYNLLLTPGATPTEFAYTASTALETYGNGINGPKTVMSSNTISSFETGTVDITKNFSNKITGVAVDGTLPVRVDDNGVALTQRELVSLRFARTDQAGGYRYDFTGTSASYLNDAVVGSVTFKPGTYATATLDVNGRQTGLNVANFLLLATSGSSSLDGTLVLGDYKTNLAGESAPTSTSFTGAFNGGGTTFFTGTVTAGLPNYATYNNTIADSASNFQKVDASFSGALKIASRPDLQASIAVSKLFATTTFTANFNDGTNSFKAVGDTTSKALTLSNPDGVTIAYIDGATSADVVRDSSKVATLNLNTGIINYTDGTFESVK